MKFSLSLGDCKAFMKGLSGCSIDAENLLDGLMGGDDEF